MSRNFELDPKRYCVLVFKIESLYVFISSLSSNSPLLLLLLLPILLLLLQYHFSSLFQVYVYIKSKIKPLMMALSELSRGLECFGFLNVTKAKSNGWCYDVFFLGNIFSRDYDLFVQRLAADYTRDRSNDKLLK